MNQKQSIALWKKGKKAWNEWAEDMLAQRKKLEDSGEWSAKAGFFLGQFQLEGLNGKTRVWIKEANVDFSELRFLCGNDSPAQDLGNRKIIIFDGLFIDFWEFIFPNDANFFFSEFGGDVDFSLSKFNGIVSFLLSKFDGISNFSCTTFRGSANFRHSTFNGIADFGTFNFKEGEISKFLDATDFSLTHFEKPVSFEKAEFEKQAGFSAITSKKSFSLIDTKFKQVPDFTESSFHEPPVLDDMEVENTIKRRKWNWRKPKDKLDDDDKKKKNLGKNPRPFILSWFKIANNPTDARKFRALGKMAAEANDNQNAMEFFANEVRAKRGFQDKAFGKGSGRFWWGLLYDWLSDFGRSFIRPFVLWWATTLAFAGFYAGASISKVNLFSEALYIAIRQGLVFSGLSRSDRWDSAIAALYGVKENGGKVIVQIPDVVSYMMLVQPIISAVWIFLFFLAMRKHFKIS